MTRMQQPYRTPQDEVRGAEHDHLTLHAAQVPKLVPRSEAATVNDKALGLTTRRVEELPLDGNTLSRQAVAECHEGRARIEVSFLREEERVRHSPFQIRLQLADFVLPERAVALGATGEAIKLAPIARKGHHQRSLAADAARVPFPPVGGFLAEAPHRLLRGFGLAEGRQHAAGPPGAALSARPSSNIEQAQGDASRRQLCRHAQAGYPRADDRDIGESFSHRMA